MVYSGAMAECPNSKGCPRPSGGRGRKDIGIHHGRWHWYPPWQVAAAWQSQNNKQDSNSMYAGGKGLVEGDTCPKCVKNLFWKENVLFLHRAERRRGSPFSFDFSCFLLPASFPMVSLGRKRPSKLRPASSFFRWEIWDQQKYLRSHFLFQKSGSYQFLFLFYTVLKREG